VISENFSIIYYIYLCIPGLFNNAVTSFGYIAVNGTKVNEVQTMWKDVVMALFEIVEVHLPGGTKKNHKEPKS
jgi:hypothetical protein